MSPLSRRPAERRGARSPVELTTFAAVCSLTVTVVVGVLPSLRFAYDAPTLRAVLETVNAMVALLVAYLVAGRLRGGRRLQDLLVVVGLVLVAVANLLLTALPAALGGEELRVEWDGLIVRLVGAALLAAAALVGDRPLPESGPTRRRWLLAIGAVVIVALVLRELVLERLPAPVGPAISVDESVHPRVAGHPVALGAQVVGFVLYAFAAVAFTRQATGRRDQLLPWLAAHCVVAAAARLHYLLFPSLFSGYLYSGDVLRLASYLLLLVGAARDIRGYWTELAVLEDRRRLARDLHDGLTQELSFIYTQSRRLQSRPGDRAISDEIGGAAARALDEARLAIGALTRPEDQPFATTLRTTVESLAFRHAVPIDIAIDESAAVTPEQAEVVQRVAAEAIRNAVRHGGAHRVRVELTGDPLQLLVRDDGSGFDPDEVRDRGFGLTSMRERATVTGGSYTLRSAPGEGTQVSVSWR
jgi:signal transduction histidine kinase